LIRKRGGEEKEGGVENLGKTINVT